MKAMIIAELSSNGTLGAILNVRHQARKESRRAESVESSIPQLTGIPNLHAQNNEFGRRRRGRLHPIPDF